MNLICDYLASFSESYTNGDVATVSCKDGYRMEPDITDNPGMDSVICEIEYNPSGFNQVWKGLDGVSCIGKFIIDIGRLNNS